MELKLDLAKIPALVRREKEMELSKAKEKANAIAYSKACKRKEIKYYIMLVFILLGIGLIGNFELNAEPSIKANPATETEYPATGIVTTVSESGQFIEFTDFNGNIWEINGDPEDWACGDRIAVIMSDKGTPESIYDDEVLSTRYCGWVY